VVFDVEQVEIVKSSMYFLIITILGTL